jgi:hypothetical protein
MQGPSLSERPCALSPKLPGAVMVFLYHPPWIVSTGNLLESS